MAKELKFKYIIGEDSMPIIFPCAVDHSVFGNEKSISAGFVTFDSDGVHCDGHSHGLGIKSRGAEDEKIIGIMGTTY